MKDETGCGDEQGGDSLGYLQRVAEAERAWGRRLSRATKPIGT